jgi:hypothetical protein
MAIADEMQGIMSLPEETAAPTPEQTAAVDQMRSQLSPSEINTEMLGAAEEADPATVAEFKAELQGLQLPPEVLDMLNTMVEEILDAPQDYAALREKYMAQGLEDLLPPEFDPAFFGALNMAIDQIRGASPMAQGPMPSGVNTVEDIFTYNPATAAPASMPPEGFAQGGIASLGRNGDTMLAHITPNEAAMLRRRGGSGSINPATGLPEFFSLKGVFKKIGSAVKKFASSTVGKIVIGAALFMVAGPAAATMLGITAPAAVSAVSGFVAGAGGNLLAGGNLKDSLKAGAKGALTAGALTGITQGASAFKAIPKAVPAEVRDVVTGVKTSEATAFPANPNTAAGTTRTALPLSPSEGGTGITSVGARAPVAAAPSAVSATERGVGSIPRDFRFYEAGNGAASQSLAQAPSSATALPATAPIGAGAMPSGGASPPRNFFQRGMDRLSPGRFDAAAEAAGKTAYTDTFNQYGGNRLIPGTDAYTTAITKANEAAAAAVVKNTPGMIRQYAPLVATGLGIMAATGGFDAEQPEVPAGFEDMMKGISPGQKLLTENPERYGLRFGGVNTTYAYNPAQYAMPYAPIGKRQGGGVASLMGYKEGSPASYPRKTGHIAGPGTGTSDDVPAMLSDGEFVFTAKAVRAMGNGSRRAGAKRMYAMMKNLEGRKNG